MTKDSKKIIDFGQAELNARKRDFQVERENFKTDHNDVEPEDFNMALNIISKATRKDIGIYTRKSHQSKVKFVQLIQDNWNYALDNNFFTDEEMLFLLRIQRFLQFKSNCIVDNIHSKSAVPMNQKQIADRLRTSSSKVSRVINGLVEKGVIIKANGHKVEGYNSRTYALFINPNIMYSGDKDNLEETLKALFTNSKPLFKKFPVTLF